MNDKDFYNRLQKALPHWIAKGWISPENKAAILASFEAAPDQRFESSLNIKPSTQSTTLKPSFYALTFLGVGLFAVGIILFFASHWQVIPKIIKVSELMASLWLSYSLSGFLLSRNKDQTPLHWFGQLLLFLGNILFGVNIFLIAQIYHIDAHFSNGILLWSLASWLSAYLLRQEACLILSLILALIWTVTESNVFLRSIHWMYLPIFIINIVPILKEKWGFSWHVALITLILWLTNNIFWINEFSSINYYAFYFGLCALAAFTFWSLCLSFLEMHSGSGGLKLLRTKQFPYTTLHHYALFFFLLNLWYLTFPDLFKIEKGPMQPLNLAIFSLFIICLFLSYVWFFKLNKMLSRQVLIIGGLLLLATSIWLMFDQFNFSASMMALGFNLLFMAFLLWFITIGYEKKDVIMINLSFLFFVLFIIARYFDVFWKLLDRAFFFMGGGLLVVLGSYLLEKKRRALTKGIHHESR